MDKTTLTATASIKTNKLDAIQMYLKQTNNTFQQTLDEALNDALDRLYTKTVPPAVQTYLATLNGEVKDKKPKARKPVKRQEVTSTQTHGNTVTVSDTES